MKGCHVVAHDWATWHHTICRKWCHVSQHNLPKCQPIQKCHVIVRPPCQRTVMPCQHPYALYELPSQRPFFTCLTIQTDRDISRSRHPFETKWIALGSWRRGLHSCLFWGNSENLDFWAKIWLLVQILITHYIKNALLEPILKSNNI
jgi:hypothetical protein